MAVEVCPICKEPAILQGHKCKPLFECRFAKDGPIYFDENWTETRAFDAEDAAEKFCEEYDCYGEYVVIRLGESNAPTVEVRKPGEEMIHRFVVVGESLPTYHAEPAGE